MHHYQTAEKLDVAYLGPLLEEGPCPTFLYFSLSHLESLSLPPYNQPATYLASKGCRVISFNLPGHGEGFDKFKAIPYWAEEMLKGNDLITIFIEKAAKALEKIPIDYNHFAVGGLSRGAFLATHLAAYVPTIQTVLGFAPMTALSESLSFSPQFSHFNLEMLVEKLTHLHHLRFYIGNRDELVHTDSCYRFIRKLTDYAYEVRARTLEIELLIKPAIGHKGHGTASHIFEEGAAWAWNQIRGEML